jgi:hypothetical protein
MSSPQVMMIKSKQKTVQNAINSSRSTRYKALWPQCLTSKATDLVLLRANNNGKIPYGAISRHAGEYKDSFPWLNKDMVKNHIRRLNKVEESKESTTTQLSITDTFINLAVSSSGAATTTTSSSLSCSSAVSNIDLSSSLLCKPGSASIVANNTVTDSVAKRGRPKGTTIKHAQDLKCQIELASKDATEKFSQERECAKQKNSRTKRGIIIITHRLLVIN